MNKILIPLIILIMIGSVYTLYQVQPIAISGTDYSTIGVNGSQTINGTSTEYNQAGTDYTLTISETLGFMAIVAVIEIIAVVAGINVLGSGLSDVAVRIIYKNAGLMILWSVLSVSALQPILEIPYGFGLLGYLIMTLVYIIGIIESV